LKRTQKMSKMMCYSLGTMDLFFFRQQCRFTPTMQTKLNSDNKNSIKKPTNPNKKGKICQNEIKG